jgi:transposase
MLGADSAAKVYLAAGASDLRKSIDGLAVAVAVVLGADPLSRHFFVFFHRGRDKIKILQRTGTGFWLHYKRTEQGRFHWPAADTDERCRILSRRELEWLLEGLALQQAAAHQHLGCGRVC